jgi:hypothetical protein
MLATNTNNKLHGMKEGVLIKNISMNDRHEEFMKNIISFRNNAINHLTAIQNYKVSSAKLKIKCKSS